MFGFLSQFIPKIVIYIVLLIVWCTLLSPYIVEGCKNFKKEDLNDALSIVIALLITSSVLSMIVFKVEANVISKGNGSGNVSVLLTLFSALIHAPIVEELVNRCALGIILEKWIKKEYIINVITAIIFAFMHLYKMDVNCIAMAYYGAIYVSLGYVCGYMYRKNNNIMIPIVIHFLWNSFMLLGEMARMHI